MNAFEFILIALAVYRLSYMLVIESGPLAIFVHLRNLLGATDTECARQRYNAPYITNVLCCLLCTSVWVSALMLGVWELAPIVVYWLGIAGAMLVVFQVVQDD